MNIDYDKLFRFMCKNGYIDDIKKVYNLKPTINISADDEYAFKWSCENGHLDVAKVVI